MTEADLTLPPIDAADAALDGPPVDAADTPAPQPRVADLEREADIAADYLEGLLDVLDLDGDIDLDVEGSRASVSIVADPDDPRALDVLVGRDGEVLDALQELTRLAVAQGTGERSRLMLDVAGHRARRREQLAELARDAVAQVRATGQDLVLEPMTPFERKVVHDTVASEGLVSESEGEEPSRRVVVRSS